MDAITGPTDMTVRAWWHALRDAAKAFQSNNLSDRAAALTYYSMLSIFPGLIVLVSLLGVLGNEDTVNGLLRIVEDLGSASAVDTLRGPLDKIVENSGTAGVALIFGTAIALYSASGYIGGFIRASNEIWGVDEERPFYKLRPLQLLITLVMAVILTFILMVVVLSGPLADAIGSELGIGDTALQIWSLVRWPLLFASRRVRHRAALSRRSERAARGPAMAPPRKHAGDGDLARSPRPASTSTSPTSAPTRTPTGASPAWWSS